jgi:membrane-associated protease RseP (regulator of RpoE activity)
VPIPVPVDPERLLENFGGLGLDEDAARELRQRMDEVRRQMEEMRKQMQQQGFRGGLGGGFGGGFGGLGGGMALPGDPFGPLTTAKPRQPRLGAQVRVPNQTLVDQLELPRDQGLVLEEVGPNTAAGKAGLKSHDILLELDGKPVPSKVDEFLKQLEGVQANKPVDVVVLRKGKKETVKGLNLPEVKAEERPAANQPRAGRLSAPLLGGNNRNAMTTFNRTNDDFTVRHRDNGLSIQLRGAINQGNAQVTEIVIDEDGKKTTYTSVDKVPAEYRAKVQKLAEMSAKGNIRVPFE